MQGAKFCASVDKPVSLSMSERLKNGIQSEHLFAPVYDVTEHKLRKLGCVKLIKFKFIKSLI